MSGKAWAARNRVALTLATLATHGLNGKGRQARTAQMVLMTEGRPEQGHEAVAGKLRRGTAIATHLGQARSEESVDQVAHPLRSEAFGEGGRVDDVAKENGNLLHFAGKGVHPPGGLDFRRGRLCETRRCERRPALPAEFVFGRVGCAA